MVSTVTTTVVSVVTIDYLAAPLGAACVVLLVGLLIQKELTSSNSGPWVRLLGRVLNIAIIPLFMAFAFTLIVKVADILSQ